MFQVSANRGPINSLVNEARLQGLISKMSQAQTKIDKTRSRMTRGRAKAQVISRVMTCIYSP